MKEWIVKIIAPNSKESKIYVDAHTRAEVFEKLFNAQVAGAIPVGSEFQIAEK